MSVYKISVRFLKSHLRTEHLTKAILFWREWGLGWEILTAAEKKSQPKHSNKKIHPAYNPLSFSVTIHNLPLSLLLSLSLSVSIHLHPSLPLCISLFLPLLLSCPPPLSLLHCLRWRNCLPHAGANGEFMFFLRGPLQPLLILLIARGSAAYIWGPTCTHCMAECSNNTSIMNEVFLFCLQPQAYA